MEKEEFVLCDEFSPKDNIDSDIIRDHLMAIMILQIKNLLNSKDKFEKYFNYIRDCTEHLLKANSDLRRYVEEEKKTIENFKEKNLNKYTVTYNALNPVELNALVDDFLVQIKGSFDTLAQSFQPIFDVKIHGWHRIKNKSGKNVVNNLNNLAKSEKEKAQDLIYFIEKNTEYITYIVDLRDGIHRGGLKNISHIFYDYKKNTIIPQIISHPNGQREYLLDFLKRTISEISQLTSSIMFLSLLALAPGLAISRNTNDKVQPYSWHIITSIKK